MAQVVFEFGEIGVNDTVLVAASVTAEEITSTGTSQATTASSDVKTGRGVCEVTNNGAEDVWVTFASSPTAAVGTTHFIPTDRSRSFIINDGDKGAVINDA